MKYKQKLEKWMFAFFVKKFKVTFLLTFLIAIAWIYSVTEIPKESMPVINLPMVTVNTIYDWIDAKTIDDEITEEIEDSLEDIDGISKYTSTSSEGKSSINITIDNTYDIDEVVSDIEDAVDWVSLPSEVEDPYIRQREFNSTEIFKLVLYAKDGEYSFNGLLAKAETIKKSTEWKTGIKEVAINTNTIFDVRIILDKDKLDILWLTIDNISSSIQNNNVDKPLWSYKIDNKNFDYRFTWEIVEIKDLLSIPVVKWDSIVTVWDISEMELYYWDDIVTKFWKYEDFWYNYISLDYSKYAWDNVFDVAWLAKWLIETELKKSEYKDINFYYTDDKAQDIMDDYSNLVKSAGITIFVVFLTLIFFVWFREATIATLLLPLAFLLSFVVVGYQWQTLNFITNFAFVLSFWIAIDTIIIIVEWASEKLREWFKPKTAILIAIKEFKSPLIIWTLTTLAAFIPILSLPGMMWIMLSLIPNVVFITLISTLLIALFITWTIFIAFSKNKTYYEKNEEREKVRPKEERELLKLEREWKHQLWEKKIPLRDRIFMKYSWVYKKSLKWILSRKRNRIISTLTPVLLLVFVIVTITPNLWFEIFPSWKNDKISMNITAPDWYEPNDMNNEISYLENTLSSTEEIDSYTLSVNSNKISVTMYLTPSEERMREDKRDNDELQKDLTKVVWNELKPNWYNVWVRASKRWRPSSSMPVWIKLVTQNQNNYEKLIEIAEDFENFLLNTSGISETSISASSSLWQIEFKVDESKAALMWVDEKTVMNMVSSAIRWKTVGSYKSSYDDHDIVLMIDDYKENLSPSDIENINLYIWWQTIKAGALITYDIKTSAPNIKRVDWYINVWVEADIVDAKQTQSLQTALNEFASSYNFPDGTTYQEWWENVENEDLINSVIRSVFVAFFLIFAVLVFQFNSFAQPVIILYSVFMALIWVNIWLWITWNPMSMPAWIWFISLMWIVVNDAIVYMDKINRNIDRWMEIVSAITNAWVSRLNPILVTTITTVAW
jgi:multidrug efflux pump subunit AcrB